MSSNPASTRASETVREYPVRVAGSDVPDTVSAGTSMFGNVATVRARSPVRSLFQTSVSRDHDVPTQSVTWHIAGR